MEIVGGGLRPELLAVQFLDQIVRLRQMDVVGMSGCEVVGERAFPEQWVPETAILMAATQAQ